MNRHHQLLVFSLCALALAGCATARVPTTAPVEIVTITVSAPTVFPTAQATSFPAVTPTTAASATPTIALANPTPTPRVGGTVTPKGTLTRAPIPTAGMMQVKLYFVALNDNGKSGKKIGCDDSIVPVQKSIPQTSAPLTAALKELLAVRDQNYGQSGLYNALYQANLKLSGVAITDSRATINLTGSLSLRGVCDNPRVIAQIQETALQFPTVKQVSVLLNGVPLEQVLSGRGG